MTAPTFFADDLRDSASGRRLSLSEDESRHVRALRLETGDVVAVTDGMGRRWSGRLLEPGPPAVCELVDRSPGPEGLPVELGVAVAAKDRTLWLIEKAVELGALGYQPVEVVRSRSVADAGRSTSFWRKAGRRAVAALKQCGGDRIPEIGPVRDLHDYVSRSRRPAPGDAVAPTGPDLVLDRGGDTSLARALDDWSGSPPLRILVGPEGGLEPGELDACRAAGFRPVHLGPRNLRFETAAVFALSAVGGRVWSGAGSGAGSAR